MALVTGLTKPIKLSDTSEAVIRKLTWKQLRKAARDANLQNLDNIRHLGGEVFKAITESGSKEDAVEKVKAIQEAQKANPDSYDAEVTITHGLVSIDGRPLTPEDKDELDAGVAELVHREIVAFSRETVTKNG